MSFKLILEKYIKNPEQHKDFVIFYNEEVVILKDAYPKARVHWLIMPRDSRVSRMHPLKALRGDGSSQIPPIYEMLGKYVDEYKQKASDELRKHVKKSINYEQLDDNEGPLIRCGVHAVPSLDNLHVHIISKDLHSSAMKRPVHYSTFTTRFFVPYNEIPHIPENDPRLSLEKMTLLEKTADHICIWCGVNFHRSFVKIKKHIDEEYYQRFID